MDDIKTIYVGDILNTADEDFLRSLFEPFGEIFSFTIHQSNKPVPNNKYAFITYGTHEEAEKAVEEMNYTELDSYPIRVSLADPNFKKIQSSGRGNVTLRNLDPSIDTKQLHEAFQQYGEVISCRIPKGKNGEHFGVAYIQFKNPDDAKQAIEEMKGMTINDKPIYIGEFNPIESSPNVRIKSGIPITIKTTQDLKSYLIEQFPPEINELDEKENTSIFSNIKAALLTLPENTDYRQAYLTFPNLEFTQLAFEKLEKSGMSCERVIESDKINHMKQNSSQWDMYKKKESQKRCLVVMNIPNQYPQEELENFFSQFADISKCTLNNKNELQMAFITFKTEEGAKYALKKSVLACSHLKKKQRKGQKYPLQLKVSRFVDKENRLKTSNQDRDRAIKIHNELDNRVRNGFGPESMQYERFKQLSQDQIEALMEDDDLYEDWVDEDNNQQYEEDSEEEDDDDEESVPAPQPKQYRGGNKNYRPNKRGFRGQRGGRRPYRNQRGGRGNRGGYYGGYNNHYNDNFDDDIDYDEE